MHRQSYKSRLDGHDEEAKFGFFHHKPIFKKHIPIPVYKPVPKPFPVYKPIPKPVPVPVYKPIPKPVYKPIPKPVPVYKPIPKPVPVPVYKPIPKTASHATNACSVVRLPRAIRSTSLRSTPPPIVVSITFATCAKRS